MPWARIVVLGASYKAGVGDIRESPAIRIMEVLIARGAELSYHDPFVPSLPELALESVRIDSALDDADAVVLVTAHPGIDYAELAGRADLFIDLQGVTRALDVANRLRLQA